MHTHSVQHKLRGSERELRSWWVFRAAVSGSHLVSVLWISGSNDETTSNDLMMYNVSSSLPTGILRQMNDGDFF